VVDHSLKRLEARLGWLTAGLALLSAASAVVAVVLVRRHGTSTGSDIALLPVSVELNRPALATFVAAIAFVAAVFMAISAVQVAAALHGARPRS